MPSAPREPTGGPHTAQPLAPGLYIVATPIGHLRDISLRALDVLAAADLVLAEDTRVTAKLMNAYGVNTTVRPYHDHNASQIRPEIVNQLSQGAAIALVSDAGTPLVSDPGHKLVRDAVAAGVAVIPIPGPSAVLAGLVVAGLPTDRFFFAGFPPPKTAARRAALADLASVPATLVFYESGPRLAASLADMAAVLGDRPAAVARELTKRFEETRRDRRAALAETYAAAPAPKGEIVVLVGPPERVAWDDAAVDAALAERVPALGAKRAAAEVAAAAGRPARDVYARAIALRAAERE